MENFEQKRAAALARIASNQAAAAERAARAALIANMKREGARKAITVKLGIPLVRIGGDGLNVLREDVFDAANNTNGRAGLIQDIDAAYDSAMMGGEPYAKWN